ncbi:VOC family protein [Archangium violaceum]|uniref:VOC family protein n=1 Tax=Archangium violaceum TaxID=83451 RepID=UPI002B316259|nr:VOC family protein [Archangium violaceum]
MAPHRESIGDTMSHARISLCHVFVLVESGAPEAARLEQAGLRESFRRVHPGQGTTNVCYCFDNAYLELLWAVDGTELASPAVAPTRLAERAAWRSTGANPFGIALRTDPPEAPLPFATWDYQAPFLPSGRTLPVAHASKDPRQPFLFRSLGSARPDQWTDGRAGERQRGAGLSEIVALHLMLPPGLEPAAELRQLEQAGLLTLGTGEEGPRMLLTLSGLTGGPPKRLSLPDFGWSDPSCP